MTGPREACGVVALYAPRQEPARLAFFALYALQPVAGKRWHLHGHGTVCTI
jgi:hypothetical protein